MLTAEGGRLSTEREAKAKTGQNRGQQRGVKKCGVLSFLLRKRRNSKTEAAQGYAGTPGCEGQCIICWGGSL